MPQSNRDHVKPRLVQRVVWLGLILCALLNPQDAYSQNGYYLNPGFKFGHTFGETGGFTIGLEVTYTTFSTLGGHGIVASFDYCRNADRYRIHLGGEYLFIDIGPTLILERGSGDVGINLTPYVGVVVIPYYSYTLRFTKDDLHETGAFLKFPILVKGRGFRLGH